MQSGSCIFSRVLGPVGAERGMPTSPSAPSLRNRLNYGFGGGSHLCLLTHCHFYLGHCTLIYGRVSSYNPRRGVNLLLLQGRDGSGEIAWDRFPWCGVTRRLGFSPRAHVANPALPLPTGIPRSIPKISLCDCDTNLPQKIRSPPWLARAKGGFSRSIIGVVCRWHGKCLVTLLLCRGVMTVLGAANSPRGIKADPEAQLRSRGDHAAASVNTVFAGCFGV